MNSPRPAFTLRVDLLNGARVPVFTDKAAVRAWEVAHRDPAKPLGDLLASADACAVHVVGADHVHRWAVFVPLDASPTRIGHECLHLAWYLLDSHGVAVDVYNHEVLAYLQEHLASQILARLN